MTTHSLELTAAHVAGIARMVPGAYGVSFDDHGAITFQGQAEDMRDVPDALGLFRDSKRDHSTGTTHFRLWSGVTVSAFGTFATRVVMCEPVEEVTDCYTVELT